LFDDTQRQVGPLTDIRGARILAMFGDMVTTEHVSPMGVIPADAPAGRYLQSLGIAPPGFRQLCGAQAQSRRDDPRHVRERASPQRNDASAARRLHRPYAGPQSHADSRCRRALSRRERSAGRGCGSALRHRVIAGLGGAGPASAGRARGTRESFERIHRSNLVAAGVLPLQFAQGETRRTLKLDGSEVLDITGLGAAIEPGMQLNCTVTRGDGSVDTLPLTARLDTRQEAEYFRHGGALNCLLRKLCA
jgi:aconitate hydratase